MSRKPVPEKPFGRPTKYKPEYCQLLVEHMSQGYSFDSFAGRSDIRVTRSSLYEWRDKYPDFSDAYKKGEASCLYFLESAAIAGSLNPGKNPVNTGLLCFLIKNRIGWKDKVEQEVTVTNANHQDEKAIADKLIEAVKLAHAIT